MKRRQRRHVLDINGEQSDSPRRRWQNKHEEVATERNEENGGPSNPLTHLSEQYNSDSETEDWRPEKKQLDDKVNDFLKEIQLIAPEPPAVGMAAVTGTGTSRKPSGANVNGPRESSARVEPDEPSSLWQECVDDSTGYSYYWHVETNEVTWDVPEEIRLSRERNQQDSLNRTCYSTQWVNFASNTYPQAQINIPEGMIPKEVVARNRNRQVSSQQKVQRGAGDVALQNSSRNSISREDESDDGKIEMITSFGSDGSESETSDNDSPAKRTAAAAAAAASACPSSERRKKSERRTKPAIPASGKNAASAMGVKRSENNEKVTSIGPSLPAEINSDKKNMELGRREKWCRKDEEEEEEEEEKGDKCETSVSKNHSSRCDDSSLTIGDRSAAQSRGNEVGTSSSGSSKQLKFSLVPGYADDSDAEEEACSKKTNEPLFPIAEFTSSTATTIVSQDGTVKKVETKYTDSGSVRIFQYQSSAGEKTEESPPDAIKQTNDPPESDALENFTVEETRVARIVEETPKPNIFLDNLETPSKAFQRKRRIAFDVIPSKSRGTEVENLVNNKPETPVASPPAALLGNEADRHGLGFQKETRSGTSEQSKECPDAADRETNSPTTEKQLTAVSSKGTINFVRGETMIPKPAEQLGNEKIEARISEMKEIPETIMEKLRFLSEGGQPASAVQVMAIQLQTLLAAWEAGDLKDSYMENWLNGIARELGRLEEAAAPPGWNCQWDRSHKRYFYRNSTSGEAQWTYPEADVIGGTEEMELCTTPPPQGQEESCIIEAQTDKPEQQVAHVRLEIETTTTTTTATATATTTTTTTSEESTETKKVTSNDTSQAAPPPPPPQISSPSPPPPPRIYAEDMKKGKKRRGSIQGKVSETKREKASKDTKADDASSEVNPPLPPSPTRSAQPPLPPHPPIIPNPPNNSEPLPPGVDPPDMPFTLAAPAIETTMLYTATAPQTNPIYAATIGDPTLLGHHHTALMQGQLMHYPTYHQHLHNQALIAAANRLSGQEAVQFMVDYSQVYTNAQVIAKPPIKSHKESLGSALDSFYSDIASMESTKGERETEQSLPVEPVSVAVPQISQEPELPAILTDSVLKERKKKKAKLGISKKQKEVSSMVAKWQKAQHYEDND